MAFNRIKIRHLQCFIEVVRVGSVTRAAEILALTQPAVSKTLNELEEEVGGKLLNRTRAGVSLTELGEIFHRRAATSISALRQGVDEVAQASSREIQAVAVGAMSEVMTSILPRAVMLFKDIHPNTGVRVVYEANLELLSLLRLGEIDFVIGRPVDREQMEGLSFEPLFSEAVTFVVRPDHPLIGRKRLNVRALVEFPMHLQFAGTGIRRTVERFLTAHGVTVPANHVESRYYPFARSMTRLTDSVLVSSGGVVSDDVRDGVLAELPIDTSAMGSAVGLTSDPAVPASPLATTLMDFVRRVVRDNNLAAVA